MGSVEACVIFEETEKGRGGRTSCSLLSPSTFGTKPKTISELSSKIVLASLRGWLLVTDSNDPASVFLFNPFSRLTIHLPRLDLLSEELISDSSVLLYHMTCAPDHDDDRDLCVVMVCFKTLILFCRPSCDDSWDMHRAHIGIILQMGSCNGDILCVVTAAGTEHVHRLLYRLTFDESHSSNLTITLKSVGQLKWSFPFQGGYSWPCLVESCGHLYCVMIYYGHGCDDHVVDVRVYKFVESETTVDVVVVESIENQALFIGNGSCSSSYGCYVPPPTTTTTTTSPSFGLLQENCVYILRTTTSSGEGVICRYHLQERTLSHAPLFPNHKVLPSRCPLWITSTTGNKRNVAKSGVEIKIRENEEIRQHGTQIGDLPCHLVSDIAMRLGVTDYSRFRTTCKTYRDLTLPLQFWSSQRAKIEYLLATKSEMVLPWLLHVRGDSKMCKVIDPIYTDNTYLMTTPWDESHDTVEIVYSKDGWLLMHGLAGNLFFYNPFTKVSTAAAIPTNNGHRRCMGSSATPPITETDVVVGLYSERANYLEISSYIHGDREWGVTDVACEFTPANNSPVYYKNAFYYLDKAGRLGRLKVLLSNRRNDSRHKWKTFLKPRSPIDQCNSEGSMTTYLLECDGDILSVFASIIGEWVKVFRLDMSRKRWVRVDNLKNHMIFLSPYSCFAEPAPINRSEFGNKLYFPKVNEKNEILSYDLKSRRYSTSDDNNNPMFRVKNLFERRELLGYTWIQPQLL